MAGAVQPLSFNKLNSRQSGGWGAAVDEEVIWLRAHVIRLRTALRFAHDHVLETILREVIADAEDRLSALDRQWVAGARDVC